MRPLLFPVLLLLLLSAPFPALRSAAAAGPAAQEEVGRELAVGLGYAWGWLRNSEELQAVPLFVRIGFDLGRTVGIDSPHRSLSAFVEPFANPVGKPGSGVEAGCAFGLRYLHGLAGPLSLYLEGAVAPMFFSVSSIEQGAGGFNFLDYAGSGLQYRLKSGLSLFMGLRLRHLSHAGIADRSNDGINSQAVVTGLSWQP